jgi:hypothetical protein
MILSLGITCEDKIKDANQAESYLLIGKQKFNNSNLTGCWWPIDKLDSIKLPEKDTKRSSDSQIWDE